MTFSPAPAIVLAARKRYVRTFKKQKATSPDHAIDPEVFKLHNGIILKSLLRKQIIVAVTPNTFYLDETREHKIYKKERKTALILIGFIVIISFLAAFIFLLLQ